MTVLFVTGGTGYIGRALIPRLLARGDSVHALARASSRQRVPAGAAAVIGNALEAASFRAAMPRGATLVHLIGTPHPSPAKAAQFKSVDLASIEAAVAAAVYAGVAHFIYVSVAHPAPVMREYIAVRTRGEALLSACGLAVTILRPWYVLGPGHRWPYLLLPAYALLRQIPSTRDTARRLGLVTLSDMLAALLQASARPAPSDIRIIDVPGIVAAGRAAQAST